MSASPCRLQQAAAAAGEAQAGRAAPRMRANSHGGATGSGIAVMGANVAVCLLLFALPSIAYPLVILAWTFKRSVSRGAQQATGWLASSYVVLFLNWASHWLSAGMTV